MTAPVEPGYAAYDYPLLIKQLLITPLRQFPNQEIVYRDISAPHLPRIRRARAPPRLARCAGWARNTATPWR